MAKKQTIVKVPAKVQAKIEAGKLLTPQQQCQANHAGQCGKCSADGSWTAC